jgi:5,10-methylenetetrahydromethanopterin reductase
MAQVAEHTSRVQLGTAVLIPSLRHPVAQAAAVATIEDIAPGRLSVGLATGFTGRNAMGQRKLKWSFVRRYVEQLKALLAGERVEVEGAMAALIPSEGFMPPRPIAVPILLGANGPKGCAIAREIADGIICAGAPPEPGFETCAVLSFGTVLDDGEELTSPRVMDAAGAAMAVRYHGTYEANPDAVSGLPNGEAWRASVETVPAAVRHLEVHQGHCVDLSNRHDRQHLDMTKIKEMSFTGTADELRARMDSMEAGGATEIMYGTMGSDIPRELRRFAEVAGL